MKKILALLLSLCMIFCLAACGDKTSENTPIGNEEISETDTSNEMTQSETTDGQLNDSNTAGESASDATESSENHSETNVTDENSSNSANSTPSNSNDTDNSNTSGSNSNSASSSNSENSTDSGSSSDSGTSTDSNKPAHTHSFSAATCTEPKKCSCGATDGSALGHKWTDATCKAPKTCSVCTATEGNVADHKWNDATCQAPKTCSVCNKTEGSTVDHIFDSEGKCKWCKHILPVSLSRLENRTYRLIKPYSTEGHAAINILDISFNSNSGDYVSAEGWDYIESDNCSDNPCTHTKMVYSGKKYCPVAGWGAPYVKQISNNHIFLFGEGSDTYSFELELLSNNTLRIVSTTDSSYSAGDIFS